MLLTTCVLREPPADTQPEPFRTLSLLLHATGIEVSVALALKKRDIDMMRREIRARGTKTKARDRIAKVADWAWPDVEKLVRRLLPNAPIFPDVNRWTASDKHREGSAALRIISSRTLGTHTRCGPFALGLPLSTWRRSSGTLTRQWLSGCTLAFGLASRSAPIGRGSPLSKMKLRERRCDSHRSRALSRKWF